MTLVRGYDDFHWIAPTTVVNVDEVSRAVAQSLRGKRAMRESVEGSHSITAGMASGSICDTNKKTLKRVKHPQSTAGTMWGHGYKGGSVERGTQEIHPQSVGENCCSEGGPTPLAGLTGKGKIVGISDNMMASSDEGIQKLSSSEGAPRVPDVDGLRRRSMRLAKSRVGGALGNI